MRERSSPASGVAVCRRRPGEDKAASQIRETALHGDSWRLPFLSTWVLRKVLHTGQGSRAFHQMGVCPLRHPDLCRGRNPPLALRVSSFPTCHPGLSWIGSGMVGCSTPPIWPRGPDRPSAVSHPALPNVGPCLLTSQLPRSGSLQLPWPSQVCMARGGQTAGQAERHL